jgi:hypothetical protein
MCGVHTFEAHSTHTSTISLPVYSMPFRVLRGNRLPLIGCEDEWSMIFPMRHVQALRTMSIFRRSVRGALEGKYPKHEPKEMKNSIPGDLNMKSFISIFHTSKERLAQMIKYRLLVTLHYVCSFTSSPKVPSASPSVVDKMDNHINGFQYGSATPSH